MAIFGRCEIKSMETARRGLVTGLAALTLALVLALILGTAPAMAEPPALAPEASQADRVLVRKADRRLILYRGEEELVGYDIALGREPLGHKQREGDGRTPEGSYLIDWRNPQSSFHLSLHISYPDAEDKARAARRGESPGGMIMIHGLPNGMANGMEWLGAASLLRDWTEGCIAVTNEAIRDIWRRVPDGTPIEILP